MSKSIERTFATATDAARYAAGYDRGLEDGPGYYNAYAMIDLIWGMGYRDAQQEFSPPQH